MNQIPVILTSLIAVVASVIPHLTNKANNKHQLELKRLDMQQEKYKLDTLHKRELFEDYLRVIGEFSYSETKMDLSELSKTYYLILPYIPKDKTRFFKEFSRQLSEEVLTSVENKELNVILHDEIIPTIKEQIKQLYT